MEIQFFYIKQTFLNILCLTTKWLRYLDTLSMHKTYKYT